MKTRYFSALLLLILIAGAFQLQAKEFKGIITYNITYPDSDIPDELRTFLPKTMYTVFKGSMSRTEMNMGMGKSIVIKNGEDQSTVTLLDMMGHKIAVQSTWEEIEAEMAEESRWLAADVHSSA